MDILQNLGDFHAQILQWYVQFGRKELPWRNLARDGSKVYEIYVSEIMLQQTQLKRVLELYYFPFLKRFSSLEALALATEDEVLSMWQGLGFYSRARNMRQTARICMQKFNKSLPHTIQDLLKLPGIGIYTAGAILCFGFGESVGFVDGNIKRLLCRLFGLLDDKEVQSFADILLDRNHSFEYNQALLDLGATICTPKSPHCLICPLRRFCKGQNNPLAYPKITKKAYESLEIYLLIITDKKGRIALIKAESMLYKGLYNLPQIPSNALDSNALEYLGSFKHSYTRFKITTKVWRINNKHQHKILQKLGLELDKMCFFIEDDLPPISNLSKKALQLFKNFY